MLFKVAIWSGVNYSFLCCSQIIDNLIVVIPDFVTRAGLMASLIMKSAGLVNKGIYIPISVKYVSNPLVFPL